MRPRPALALAFALVVAGCASDAPAPGPVDPPSPSGWVVPEAVLDPRMLTFSCDEDPERAARTLTRWLDLVGERVVRIPGAESARLPGPTRPDDEAPDLLMRWRRGPDGLDVQFTSVGGLRGDDCRSALASLAFAMGTNGIHGEPAQPSGCAPPELRPPGSCTWREAIDAEFARIGMVMLRQSPEQGGNVSWYGPRGGEPAWRVDCTGLDGPLAALEFFREDVPFDAKGERDLLAKVLRRMGVVPWGLYPRERMPSPGEE